MANILFSSIPNQITGGTSAYGVPNDTNNNFISLNNRYFNIYVKGVTIPDNTNKLTITKRFTTSFAFDTLRVNKPSTNLKNTNGKKLI